MVKFFLLDMLFLLIKGNIELAPADPAAINLPSNEILPLLDLCLLCVEPHFHVVAG